VKDDPATSYNVRMAAFSFDYLRLERMRPTLDKATDEQKAEAKDIRLAESYDRFGHIVWKWRTLVAPPQAEQR